MSEDDYQEPEANECGGYYCSEEHGHIDCNPAIKSMTKIRLWLIRETNKARLYCKHGNPNPEESDCVWVPLSIVEHTTKRGNEHVVTLPDWFIEKEGL